MSHNLQTDSMHENCGDMSAMDRAEFLIETRRTSSKISVLPLLNPIFLLPVFGTAGVVLLYCLTVSSTGDSILVILFSLFVAVYRVRSEVINDDCEKLRCAGYYKAGGWVVCGALLPAIGLFTEGQALLLLPLLLPFAATYCERSKVISDDCEKLRCNGYYIGAGWEGCGVLLPALYLFKKAEVTGEKKDKAIISLLLSIIVTIVAGICLRALIKIGVALVSVG